MSDKANKTKERTGKTPKSRETGKMSKVPKKTTENVNEHKTKDTLCMDNKVRRGWNKGTK